MDYSGIPLIPIIVAAVVLFLLLAGIVVIAIVVRRSRSSAPHASSPGPSPTISAPPSFTASQPQGAATQFGNPAPAPSWGAPAEPAPPPPPPPAPEWTPAPEPATRAPEPDLMVTAAPPPMPPGLADMQAPRSMDPSPYATVTAGGPPSPLPSPELFMTTPNSPRQLPTEVQAAHLRADDGSVIALDRPVFRLGRHPECEIVIPTPGASRQHAEIEFREGYWVVSDLNSGNGTFVNNVRVKSHQLNPGDEVRVDQTRFTFNTTP